MSIELLTPVNQGAASVDLANRRFRKQILPLKTIDYNGREIKFDKQYLTDLATAFKEKAFDQTAYQLADEKNTHTNDPERTRGEMVDVELAEDGLYGVFDVTEQGLESLQATKNKLGVSARIIENYKRADGKFFPRAIQHVLGTLDPRITGMKPWQEVALSNQDSEVTETIDLSAAGYPDGKEENMADKAEGDVETTISVELTPAEFDALKRQRAGEDAAVVEPSDVEDGEEDDEVKLTAAQMAAIELTSATAEVTATQVLELTRQLRASEVEREIEKLRHAGLAPIIIEAARPVLELAPQAIELSNGNKVDPGVVLRDVLAKVLDLGSTGEAVIDLGVERGLLMETDSVQETRSAQVAAWADMFDK